MTDYKNIADNDPGGDLATAYATMKAETEVVTPVFKLTYTKIANLVSLNAASALQAAVLNPGTGIPEWVDSALKGSGIDVNNTQTQALLTQLGSNSYITVATADAIKALGNVTVAKYTGLSSMEFLKKARTLRTAGII
tara:strand:- start:798 stop:1211 length:414 start_codon:yes stop_codon:yes gene_type:complete